MSNPVIDAIRQLIPSNAKRNSRGWYQWHCPSCGDKRYRFNMILTSTDGFRSHCFNGGCEYETPTGWEPDRGLIGRARKLFVDLGGNLLDIPASYLEYHMDEKREGVVDWNAWFEGLYDDTEKKAVIPDFPEIKLPDGTEYIWESMLPQVQEVKDYMIGRGKCFENRSPICWSPKYPRHAIIPFRYKAKWIGWIARNMDKDAKMKHLKCPHFPTDYMYNLDKLYKYDTLVVQEGPFDAMMLDTLCTFGSTISKRQVEMLKHTGKKVILLPDYKLGTNGNEEWRSYWQTAKRHGFYLSCPEWPGTSTIMAGEHIKDAGDSIKRNGLLLTLETAMTSVTNDYDYAEVIYKLYSR